MKNYLTILLLLIVSTIVEGNAIAFGNAIEVRTPIPGVVVWVDEELIGETERFLDINFIRKENISPGEHNLRCVAEGYETYTATVMVPEDKAVVHDVSFTARSIKVEQIGSESGLITKAVGEVAIKSIPTKATATLGSSIVGKTDLVLYEVPVGEHKVEVYFDRTKPRQYLTTSFEVSETDSVVIIANFISGTIEIDANYRVSIDSKPNGEVYIDGERVGVSPIVEYNLNSGGHNLQIKKEGYYDHNQSFSLWRDSFITVDLTVKPKIAYLKVLKDPDIGEEPLQIKGEGYGYTPSDWIDVPLEVPEERIEVKVGNFSKQYTFENGLRYQIRPNNPLRMAPFFELTPESLNGYVHCPPKPRMLPESEVKTIKKHKVWNEELARSGSALALIGWAIWYYSSADEEDGNEDTPTSETILSGLVTTVAGGILLGILGKDVYEKKTVRLDRNITNNMRSKRAWTEKCNRIMDLNRALLQKKNAEITKKNEEISRKNETRGEWEIKKVSSF